MSKKGEMFVIESEKGYVTKNGVQEGEFTDDLAQAKLYDSALKASNMMKGWSQKSGWGVECWVARIRLEVAGKVEGAVSQPVRKPAKIRKKAKAAKKSTKKKKKQRA